MKRRRISEVQIAGILKKAAAGVAVAGVDLPGILDANRF